MIIDTRSNILTNALELAKKGFYVFPLVPNGKTPALKKSWKEHATRDADQIQAWWGDNPEYNIGIALHKYNGGSEMLVGIDVDVRNGKTGDQTLLLLEMEKKFLPETLIQTTASGGQHFIYKTKRVLKQAIDNAKRKNRTPGIDIIANYLVGAGSVINGKPYTANECVLSEVPDWVVTHWDLESKDLQKSVVNVSPTDINQQHAISRAVEYLKQAPPAIEGEGGDATTYAVACKVREFGVDILYCLELMLQHWNDFCEPPWQADELERKINNAYSYAKEPLGSISPEAEFTPITEPLPHKVKEKPSRLFVESYKDIVAKTEKLSLVQDTLDFGAMSVVYGESNSGKSFWVLHLAHAIATGSDWFNKRVQKGAVVYVSAEAGGSFRKRVVAIKKDTKTESSNIPFGLVPCSIDLLDPKADTKPLIELIKSFEKTHQTPISLVVVDTLARAIAGGNENSPDDMGALVGNLDHIREATGAHVLVVHHSGKDRAKGARGHSSLRAATDTEIEIAGFCASVTKQRDFESGQQLPFALEPIIIGKNILGEPVESCVVRTRSFDDSIEPSDVDTKSVPGRMLTLVTNLLKEDGTLQPGDLDDPIPHKMIDIDTLREEFFSRHYHDASRSTRSYAFSRALKKLLTSGHIIQRGNFIGLSTQKGRVDKSVDKEDGGISD